MSTVSRRCSTALIASSAPESHGPLLGLGQRAVHRVLEGPHPWGELDVWPSRYGFTGSALVVYTPGATWSERTRVRLRGWWSPVVVLLGTVVAIAATRVIPPIAAPDAGAAVTSAGLRGLGLLAWPSGRSICELRTWGGGEDSGALARGPQAELDQLATVQFDTERDLGFRMIDAVTSELVHGEVWRRLDASRLGHA